MKATSARRKNTWNTERKINPNISEARHRERAQYEFRIEMELIGARLRRLRMEKGHSLEQVAKALRMPKIRLHKIEHGLYIHFGVSDLHTLSRYYHASVVEILSILPDTLFDHFDY